MGKVRALKAAGWPNTKIAEEMGVSDVTIAKRIKEEEQDEDRTGI